MHSQVSAVVRLFLALWLAITPTFVWAGSMTLLGVGRPAAGGGAYVGPGDVQSGAVAWWGLRGYTAAYAAPGTNPSADICDAATGLTCTTINILSNGNFDTATASAFCTLHTSCIVKKLYDQTGGTCHQNATNNTFPALVFSGAGLGAGMPALSFNGSTDFLDAPTCTATPTPWSLSAVYKLTGFPGNIEIMGDTSGNGIGVTGNFNNANVNLNFGGTATGNVWHSVQGIDKGGGSSGITIDATQTSGAGSSANLTATAIFASAFSSAQGFFVEGGRWSGDKSTTSVALSANQKTYWGF